MSRTGYELVTALALLTCTAPLIGCRGGEETPQFDTNRYMGEWVRLWNTYDLTLVDDLFLTDSTVTYFSSETEGLIEGIDAVRAHHQSFGFVAGGRPADQQLWVEELNTTQHGRTAIVTGLWYFGDRGGAPEEIQRGPFTFVYVLRGDTYRLAHLNFGTYLDSHEGEAG